MFKKMMNKVRTNLQFIIEFNSKYILFSRPFWTVFGIIYKRDVCECRMDFVPVYLISMLEQNPNKP